MVPSLLSCTTRGSALSHSGRPSRLHDFATETAHQRALIGSWRYQSYSLAVAAFSSVPPIRQLGDCVALERLKE